MTTDRAPIQFGRHLIGPGQPVFIIAELSGNHRQSFDTAVELVQLAKHAGADAVKLQTIPQTLLPFAPDCDEFLASREAPSGMAKLFTTCTGKHILRGHGNRS